MLNQSIMHVSFNTNQLDALRSFYENALGATTKIIVRFGVYKGVKNRGVWAEKAETDPNGIAYLFEELAPGQFIELFPTDEPLISAEAANASDKHYAHFALLVDDIQAARQRLIDHNAPVDVEPNIGNSHVWQMWTHDPDGNKMEIMQYTDQAFELTGHIDEPSF